ncbi:hypothetical protein [Janibacter terrae]|uniref:hypothetical protein n=1 Tax=Janibacter terrae TaxID=103817 RepID=UPI0031F7A5F8
MLAGTIPPDDLTEAAVERFLEVLGDDELLLLELDAVIDSDPPAETACARGGRDRDRVALTPEDDVPGPTLHPPPIEPWARERSPPRS